VLEEQEALLPGPGLIKTLRDQAITTVTLPPSVLALLPDDDLPALHTLIVAGEACSSGLVARWAKGRRFFNAYGPTEATVCATIAECRPSREKPAIGRPISNTKVFVLDAHQHPVPVGVPGEMHIGGVGLARGYLNRPELETQRFISSPWSGGRLYRTGDTVRYRQNGDLEFLGRADEQVKVRGVRVELGEIESALRQHPQISAAAVLLRDDAPDEKRLTAYVVPSQEEAPTVRELRTFLQNRLPPQMVPTAFVLMDHLPLTPNGKVHKKKLPVPRSGS
jgi:acyl-coenzyme A synthetase/AMP-(fatty) acid ligase